MQVPVGPYNYELKLVAGPIDLNGEHALALCDSDRHLIQISDVAPPERRLSHFWHEMAHAWRRELDVHESSHLDDEAMANLIGLAMAHMDAPTLARIHIYLTQGIECDAVMMGPGLPVPVPILRKSVE